LIKLNNWKKRLLNLQIKLDNQSVYKRIEEQGNCLIFILY